MQTFIPSRRPQASLWKTTAVLIALVALAGGLQHYLTHHRTPTRHTAQAMSRHALTMVANFWGTTELAMPPTLWEEAPNLAFKGTTRHLLWAVTSKSEGLRLDMCFHDGTGHLCYLIGSLNPRAVTRMVAPIETPEEAGDVARHRLYDLQLVPPCATLQLEKPPARSDAGRIWQMIWRIKDPQAATPYRVYIAIDRRTGAPLWVMDRHELDAPITNSTS